MEEERPEGEEQVGAPPQDQSRLPARTDPVAWRASLATARSGSELLDRLISPPDAPRLIAGLPTEDLHRYIIDVGLADATDLVAAATGEQVRGILDAEIWERDRLSVERLDPWLEALMRAGPDVLGRRILDLDDEVVNWIVRRSAYAIAIEDPEDFHAPDAEHVMTPDNRLCVVFPEPSERDLPVKIFLDWLMRGDTGFCINLLLGATAALDANLEEEAYRWRSGRMADRGYVDYYEALVIYSPPPRQLVAEARSADVEEPPRRLVAELVSPEVRLARAIAALGDEDQVHVEAQLAYAANMAMSADLVDLWDRDAQRAVLERLRTGLVLGLDALAGAGDAAADARILAEHPVSVVFRIGYARMVEAAQPVRRAAEARRLATDAGRLEAVDLPALRPWAEALGGRHPRRPDGAPLAAAADLAAARVQAERIAELAERAAGRPREVGIGAWLFTRLASALLQLQTQGPLPAEKAAAAHRALFAEGALRAEARAAAADWWRAIGGRTDEALQALLDEAERQLATAHPDDLDPRRAPILWVG